MQGLESKVGVIIPMYGVARYLRECLDSVINQSYANLSVLLVSDGDDECLNIACDYAKLDSRIIVVDKENGGQSSAKNVGIELFNNEYRFKNIDSMQKLYCYKFLESNSYIYIYIYSTMLRMRGLL